MKVSQKMEHVSKMMPVRSSLKQQDGYPMYLPVKTPIRVCRCCELGLHAQ
jgi:hypothetical protein